MEGDFDDLGMLEFEAEDIAKELNNFDNKINYGDKVIGLKDPKADSDSEDEIPETIKLQEKNKILMDHLYENKYKQIVTMVEKEDTPSSPGSMKNKQIIKLAKKNKDLNLQIESLKTKAARAMEEVKKQQREKEGLLKTLRDMRREGEDQPNEGSQISKMLYAEIDSQKQKIQSLEQQVAHEKRQKHENKIELKKTLTIIKREVGDSANVELLLKDTTWKGRAEEIQRLKTKVMQLKGGSTMSQFTSQMSSTTNTFSTKNEKAFGDTDRKRKEIEKLQLEVETLTKEKAEIKKKLSGATCRLVTIEKELKEFKLGDSDKMRIFLQKADTDDKLIFAQKEEIVKLKSIIQKQEIKSGKGPAYSIEMARLVNDNAVGHARNQELEDRLVLKENKIEQLMVNMVGREEAYNINLDDDQIKQLQGQITDLLKENGKLKLQLKEKFPVITTGSGDQKQVIKDLSKQNVNFRKKINDLQTQLGELQKKK